MHRRDFLKALGLAPAVATATTVAAVAAQPEAKPQLRVATYKPPISGVLHWTGKCKGARPETLPTLVMCRPQDRKRVEALLGMKLLDDARDAEGEYYSYTRGKR